MKVIDEVGATKILKFAIMSFFLMFLPILFLPPLRKYYLVLFGAKIGKESILMNIKFSNAHHKGLPSFSVGNYCFVGEDCLFDLYDSVEIADEVTFGPRVTVLTHTNVGYKNHPLQKVIKKSSAKVTFKNGCFIGASSTILQGVTIGKNSIVAAGSVVTTNVANNSLYAGIPAKLTKKL